MSAHTDQARLPESASDATYERRDVAARPVIFAMLAVVVVLIVVAIGVAFLTGAYARHAADQGPPANPLAAEFAPKEPPLPRLQAEPVKDLKTLRASEDRALHSYAWIDRHNGIVRIPVERAIEITAERGLPARPQPNRGNP